MVRLVTPVHNNAVKFDGTYDSRYTS